MESKKTADTLLVLKDLIPDSGLVTYLLVTMITSSEMVAISLMVR